jgi:thioredoxin 1
MDIPNITESNFSKLVERNGIVIVDCWAPWCGACRQFAPVYERAAGSNPDVTFTKLNTDAEQSLRTTLGIEHIPTLMVYRDGIRVFSQAGNYNHEGLTDIIQQARSLDMEMIRREIAAEQPHEDGDRSG